MRIETVCLACLLALNGEAAVAGSNTGDAYTNFGNDLVNPIFPVDATLRIYDKKCGAEPKLVIANKPVAQIEGNGSICYTNVVDGWVRCNVEGKVGWINRSDFRSGSEIAPPSNWPFRYWLYVASSGIGSAESSTTREASRNNPYLIAPSQYENIFFHVLFDQHGRAISPKNRLKTGDRAFVIGQAVYLAPEDPLKRSGATWLFLGYFNDKLTALCPSPDPKSCMSAVNLAPDWQGIKALYDDPPESYCRRDKTRWFGAGEVAFARHGDAARPLMYRIPLDVRMKVDTNPISDAQLRKNREKPVCIADCPE